MADEEWRGADIPNSDHAYFVSSLGRVRRAGTVIRFTNTLTGRINVRDLPERVLALQENRRGYKIVSVQLGRGRELTVAVAPLVCSAFHGAKPEATMHCAHLNGDHRDNRPENLAWVTPLENERHKKIHGTNLAGERHHQARLTESDIRHIRKTFASGPRGIGRELAARFGVSATQITDICKRKSWAHVD